VVVAAVALLQEVVVPGEAVAGEAASGAEESAVSPGEELAQAEVTVAPARQGVQARAVVTVGLLVAPRVAPQVVMEATSVQQAVAAVEEG